MKFQIGSKVEVLSKKKTPLDAWRLAEVVYGNGDYYTVTYEGYFGISKGTLERVNKDIIRPCPPPVKSVGDWVTGDIVEALDDRCWKVAVIVFVERDGFYVRVLGSFHHFKVNKSNIRVRQAWKDNKWTILDKDSNICENLIVKAQGTLKRTFSHYSGHSEAYENSKKSRTVEEDVVTFSSQITSKVDSGVYLQGAWSQSSFHSSQSDTSVEQRASDNIISSVVTLNHIIDPYMKKEDTSLFKRRVMDTSPIDQNCMLIGALWKHYMPLVP